VEQVTEELPPDELLPEETVPEPDEPPDELWVVPPLLELGPTVEKLQKPLVHFSSGPVQGELAPQALSQAMPRIGSLTQLRGHAQSDGTLQLAKLLSAIVGEHLPVDPEKLPPEDVPPDEAVPLDETVPLDVEVPLEPDVELEPVLLEEPVDDEPVDEAELPEDEVVPDELLPDEPLEVPLLLFPLLLPEELDTVPEVPLPLEPEPLELELGLGLDVVEV
jgi:hypothetical protein